MYWPDVPADFISDTGRGGCRRMVNWPNQMLPRLTFVTPNLTGSSIPEIRPMIRKLSLAVVFVLGLAISGSAAEPQVYYAYHIGNSLTRSITMDRLHQLFAERGIDYQFSTQLAAGCTLKRHWAARETGMKTRQWETNKPADGSFEPGGPDWDPNPKRFGPYWEALTDHKWDAIVFQPYRSHLKDDLPALTQFIEFALQHDAAKRFYIYQTWPNRPARNPQEKDRSERVYTRIDYPTLWDRTYPFDETASRPKGDQFQSRDYFRKLLSRINTRFAGRLKSPIQMIPVGEVWYVCDQRIKAGEIPGLAELYARNPKLVPGWNPDSGISAGVNIFYADGIHPNPMPHLDGNVANYVNGITICAAISGQSPVGLPGSIYGLDDQRDAALCRALQQTVWQVLAAQVHHH